MTPNHSLSRYLSSHSTERLSAEVEAELLDRYQRGDKAAGDRIARAMLLFVVSEARRFRRYRHVTMDDLVAAGNMGLVKAMGMWRAEEGVRLSTYAKWWIRNYCRKFARETTSMVRRPKRKDCVGDLSLDLPTHASEAGDADTMLERLVGDGEWPADELIERREDERERCKLAGEALAALTGKEADVVRQTIMVGDNNQEMGDQNDVTRERIRQVLDGALRKMRHALDPKTAKQLQLAISCRRSRKRIGSDARKLAERKLSPQQVRDARARHAEGKTQTQLALECGVSRPTMRAALMRETYSDVA